MPFPATGRYGGDGREITISGSPVYYAGGGGGGVHSGAGGAAFGGLGGLGGGGSGRGPALNPSQAYRAMQGNNSNPAMPGNFATGGGGGGGSHSNDNEGGSGGPGIIIIKY